MIFHAPITQHPVAKAARRWLLHSIIAGVSCLAPMASHASETSNLNQAQQVASPSHSPHHTVMTRTSFGFRESLALAATSAAGPASMSMQQLIEPFSMASAKPERKPIFTLENLDALISVFKQSYQDIEDANQKVASKLPAYSTISDYFDHLGTLSEPSLSNATHSARTTSAKQFPVDQTESISLNVSESWTVGQNAIANLMRHIAPSPVDASPDSPLPFSLVVNQDGSNLIHQRSVFRSNDLLVGSSPVIVSIPFTEEAVEIGSENRSFDLVSARRELERFVPLTDTFIGPHEGASTSDDAIDLVMRWWGKPVSGVSLDPINSIGTSLGTPNDIEPVMMSDKEPALIVSDSILNDINTESYMPYDVAVSDLGLWGYRTPIDQPFCIRSRANFDELNPLWPKALGKEENTQTDWTGRLARLMESASKAVEGLTRDSLAFYEVVNGHAKQRAVDQVKQWFDLTTSVEIDHSIETIILRWNLLDDDVAEVLVTHWLNLDRLAQASELSRMDRPAPTNAHTNPEGGNLLTRAETTTDPSQGRSEISGSAGNLSAYPELKAWLKPWKKELVSGLQEMVSQMDQWETRIASRPSESPNH